MWNMGLTRFTLRRFPHVLINRPAQKGGWTLGWAGCGRTHADHKTKEVYRKAVIDMLKHLSINKGVVGSSDSWWQGAGRVTNVTSLIVMWWVLGRKGKRVGRLPLLLEYSIWRDFYTPFLGVTIIVLYLYNEAQTHESHLKGRLPPTCILVDLSVSPGWVGAINRRWRHSYSPITLHY